MSRSDDLLPVRSWDELVSASVSRGAALRRRRRLVLASPLAVVAMVAATLPLADGAVDARSDDRVLLTPADVDERRARGGASHAPTPARVAVPENAPAPAAGPSGPADAAGAPDAAAAPAASVRPVATPAPPAAVLGPRAPAPPDRTVLVAFDDPTGDAEPTGGAAAAANDPRLDLVRVEFTAGRDGIRVRLRLAAQRSPNAFYYARLVADDGCELVLLLGMEDDAYATRCATVGAYSDWSYLPRAADPSPAELEVFLPYDDFPAVLDPDRRLGSLRGESRTANSIGGASLVDEATGPGSLPGRQP